jgi:hypothetical protein
LAEAAEVTFFFASAFCSFLSQSFSQ